MSSGSDSGALAQSSITRTSIRLSRASRLRNASVGRAQLGILQSSWRVPGSPSSSVDPRTGRSALGSLVLKPTGLVLAPSTTNLIVDSGENSASFELEVFYLHLRPPAQCEQHTSRANSLFGFEPIRKLVTIPVAQGVKRTVCWQPHP